MSSERDIAAEMREAAWSSDLASVRRTLLRDWADQVEIALHTTVAEFQAQERARIRRELEAVLEEMRMEGWEPKHRGMYLGWAGRIEAVLRDG